MSVQQGLAVTPHGFANRLIAAWKGEIDDDRLFFAQFNNGGWTQAATIPGNSSTGPALACVGNQVYAAWKGEWQDERLFYAAFDGTGWSPQQTIPGNSSVGPALADYNGHLYAAWKGEAFDQRLFFSVLGHQGWAPQQQIPHVASAVGPALAAFGTKLYAVWRGMNDDQALYWASYDGQQWSPQATIPGTGSDIGPSIASFGGKLYAVWKGIKGDDSLYMAQFDGTSWSAQQKIPGVASSIGPAVASGDGPNALYALWKGESGDQRLWFSTYDGTEWSPQATIPGNTSPDPLRLIYIPDVHLERTPCAPGGAYASGDTCTPPTNPVGNQPTSFVNLCQWVKTNQPSLHFHAFLCAGDFAAQGGGSWNLPASQELAWQEGLSVAAQAGTPFICASGNHDNEQNTPGWYTYSFDQNVGHAKIADEPWYVGAWQADPLQNGSPGSNSSNIPNNYISLSNQAIAFSNGAQQVLVIVLEFVPRPGALSWADSVIAAHPTHDVILLTHWYLDLDGQPFAASETWNNGALDGNQPQLLGTSGQQLQQWIMNQPRIRLTLSGHVVTTVDANGNPQQPNIATRTDKTASGAMTAAVAANYQFTGNGRPDVQNPRPCCEVVLMLDIGETAITVRAFNTTLGTELDSAWGYPKTLSV